MRFATLAALAAVPAALAQQCKEDACADAVKALLDGGDYLSDYATDLCQSAVDSTTTLSATPTPGSGYRRRRQFDMEGYAPSWASGCKDQAEFASACECYADITATISTVTAYEPSSTPVAPVVTGTGAPYPASNSTSFPGTSSGTSVSSLPASIQFVPQAAIAAEPTGPTTLQGPISSTAPYPASNSTTFSGTSLTSLPASIQFIPLANVTGDPTGPSTLIPVSPTATESFVAPGSAPPSASPSSDAKFRAVKREDLE